jgi:hypothetical protein
MKKCLLIIPESFYSYSIVLKKSLMTFGYSVTISNDEYPANGLGKIMGKLRIPLLLRITNKIIIEKYLSEQSYDIILIFKGRGLSVQLINKLKEVSAFVVGYNFDSFKYNVAPLKWFKHLNKFYTFDYLDAEKYDLPIIELFSSLPLENKIKSPSYEISAIVRNHSNRLTYINTVLSILAAKEIYIYIFEQNIFTFFKNFMRSPLLYIKFWKYISFKPLSYDEYCRVLLESNFTIDFAHPTQSGITIRCFEALSAQTKMITNNSFVSRYKYFNEENTIVFNEKSVPAVLKNKYEKIKDVIPEKHNRTINQFIGELLSKL